MKHMLHKGHSNCRPEVFMRKFMSIKGKKAQVLHEGLNVTYRVPKNSFLKQWIYNIEGRLYWLTYVSLDMKKHLIWDLSTFDKRWRSLKNRDLVRYTAHLAQFFNLINLGKEFQDFLIKAYNDKDNKAFTIDDLEQLAVMLESAEKAAEHLPPTFYPSLDMINRFKPIIKSMSYPEPEYSVEEKPIESYTEQDANYVVSTRTNIVKECLDKIRNLDIYLETLSNLKTWIPKGIQVTLKVGEYKNYIGYEECIELDPEFVSKLPDYISLEKLKDNGYERRRFLVKDLKKNKFITDQSKIGDYKFRIKNLDITTYKRESTVN